MIGITQAAANQIDDLLDFYLLEKGRPEAARRLIDDLSNARRLIMATPKGGVRFPRPYPHLKHLGFRWLLVRVYWISWYVVMERPIVTNVCHVSADIEFRATPETDNVLDW